ncbi:hydroxyisourate hydrolase [Vreelandella subglaciescola]|jgi:5-hydroxyisourate hydrolase|uniref:5-hydroxyisourate hydrolase n=1 Tax=Vreelandella subglaciescola TaxID=29571 RepID=A0A1M7HJ09_9GAMM|nr:hydroxyisourate hydrolase [Halomonas subglaciescola]SHM28418.1 5-hydroxyisourate hydrolase [Halomonas subglaciescola]
MSMKLTTTLATGALLAAMGGTAMAADNPLSVHVLNIENGLPSPDVNVTLEQKQDDGWEELNAAVTGDNGRINALYPDDMALENDTYRVTFDTGEWFNNHDTETFFPEVPVIFEINGSLEHYHIPLLLSPYGYSTYRGN